MHTRHVHWILFFALSIVLTLYFMTNPFAFVPPEYFANYQKDSESIILLKIGILIDNPTLENLLRFPCSADPLKIPPHYTPFPTTECNGHYLGNFGIQTLFFSPIGIVLHAIGLENAVLVNALRAMSAMLTSLILLSLAWLTAKRFNATAGIALLIPFLVHQDFVAMAANLYWAPWLWLTPSLYCLYQNTTQQKFTLKSSVYLSLILTITFLHGLEYGTNTLMMTFFAFFVSYPGTLKERIIKTPIVIFGLINGLWISITIHLALLGLHQNSMQQAFIDFWDRIAKRTHDAGTNTNPLIVESINANPITVTLSYLAKNNILYTTSLLEICAILFLPMAGLLLLSTQKDRLSFLAVVSYAFITTISWHILATPHSYIHGFNGITNVLNFLPVLFGASGYLLHKRIQNDTHKIYPNKPTQANNV